jgi:hypothetical protein
VTEAIEPAGSYSNAGGVITITDAGTYQISYMLIAVENQSANFGISLNGGAVISGSTTGVITAAGTAASFSGYVMRSFATGDTIEIINNGTTETELSGDIDGAAVDNVSLVITRVGD